MTATNLIPPLVYDALSVSRILGIPLVPYRVLRPVPQAADGEILIYYGGWDLKMLRNSPAGKERMWQDQNWYDKYEWKADPGYYRLLLPVPNSNRKTWDEQVAHLRSIDETSQAAPVAVVATALIVHLMETGKDLLKHYWYRCAESLPYGRHAYLTVHEGRVDVNDGWDDAQRGAVWLAASRKVPNLAS